MRFPIATAAAHIEQVAAIDDLRDVLARRHGARLASVFATLLVALGMTPPAAAIDLSGDYVISTPVFSRLTDVQTGRPFG